MWKGSVATRGIIGPAEGVAGGKPAIRAPSLVRRGLRGDVRQLLKDAPEAIARWLDVSLLLPGVRTSRVIEVMGHFPVERTHHSTGIGREYIGEGSPHRYMPRTEESNLWFR